MVYGALTRSAIRTTSYGLSYARILLVPSALFYGIPPYAGAGMAMDAPTVTLPAKITILKVSPTALSLVSASAPSARRFASTASCPRQRHAAVLSATPRFQREAPVIAAATASGHAIATKHLSIPRPRTIPETQPTILESLAMQTSRMTRLSGQRPI